MWSLWSDIVLKGKSDCICVDEKNVVSCAHTHTHKAKNVSADTEEECVSFWSLLWEFSGSEWLCLIKEQIQRSKVLLNFFFSFYKNLLCCKQELPFHHLSISLQDCVLFRFPLIAVFPLFHSLSVIINVPPLSLCSHHFCLLFLALLKWCSSICDIKLIKKI